MSENKQEDLGMSKVEMIEARTDKDGSPPNELQQELHGTAEEKTTVKAWLSIFFLALSFGGPFWATPTTAAIASQLLAKFGQVELAAWVVPCITTAAAVSILLFGANSDLFGRRYFLLAANVMTAIGYIICALANSTSMLIAGLVFNGVGSGICGIALIAVPELIPNRYRHIGVVLADAVVYIMIVIGPIASRYAIIHPGDAWRFLYWAGFIVEVIATVGLFFLYHPPKHPRGIPWKEALRGLDWIGGVLFTIGAVLVLSGIVNTSYLKSTSPRVLVCLCVGFVVIIAFGAWEKFGRVKYKLCPPEIFTSHRGREFTVPFFLTFILVGFFYGTAVIYPTMLNSFYIGPTTSVSEELLLTLPNSLPIPIGATLLSVFGNKIGHWKWQMVVSTFSLVLWGSLLAMITPNNKAIIVTFVALCQTSYGWSVYLSVTYTQLGVPQEMLGVSGGLAGTARYAGGAVAAACYSSAIANGIATKGAELIPRAALDAGLPENLVPQVLAAASQGAAALSKIPGVSQEVIDAVGTAYKYAAAFGLRNAALASMAFGVVGIILALLCEDIESKMTKKIEVFLENDAFADKNKYH